MPETSMHQALLNKAQSRTEIVNQLGAATSNRRDHQTPCIATSLAGPTNYQDLNLANNPRAQMMGRPSLLLKT